MHQNPMTINKKTYDKIASHFARTTAWMDEVLISRTTRFVEHLNPEARLLDLGCGPGRDLSWFRQHGNHGIGADLSYGMLMEGIKAGNDALCQAEMRHLPFANRSFAGVWCNAALMHIPKEELTGVLSEIRRVLLPGGIFYFNVVQGKGEAMERHALFGKQRFFAYYSLDEIQGYLLNAGFVIHHQDEYEYKRNWMWFECGVE